MRRTKNIYHYQVKNCKKAEDQIKKDKLLSAVLDPDSEIDLFKEIKNMRKANTLSANKIDDKTKNIEEHFAGLYKTLYNSVDDQDSLQDVASIKLDEKMVDKHANDEKDDDEKQLMMKTNEKKYNVLNEMMKTALIPLTSKFHRQIFKMVEFVKTF